MSQIYDNRWSTHFFNRLFSDSTIYGADDAVLREVEVPKQLVKVAKEAAVGGVAGAAFVAVGQPMIYAKFRAQQRSKEEKVPDKPQGIKNSVRTWYRGGAGFAASFVPTVALQNAATDCFSGFGPFVAPVLGGAVSAFVVCPAELVMTQQQATGKKFMETARIVLMKYGARGFYVGFISTVVREAGFVAGYKYLAPTMKKGMQDNRGVNEAIAQILSGLGAGMISAFFTHPFDTTKTKQQANLAEKLRMYRVIFSWRSFAGLPMRGLVMVPTALTIIPFVTEKLSKPA